MSESFPPPPPPPPGGIRFPSSSPGRPALSLPRRRPIGTRSPFEVSAASAEARRQIDQIVTSTRSPWGEARTLAPVESAELEKTLRQLEARLAERERELGELETRLAERERDLAEGEALLAAREKLLEAGRRSARVVAPAVSREEQAALEQLRAELERQEASLREGKAALREREAFLEESENRLFEKVQGQQEKETELEQREADLRKRDRRLREREAATDPEVARALAAEDEARGKFNEFKE